MNTEVVTNVKAEILTNINKGINKLPDMVENSYHDEQTLNDELSNLLATNTLKFNKTTKTYNFSVEPEGDKIILDGNIFLPVTIIRKPEKILVCRGLWYEFPPDFNVNRIIWNVALNNTTQSSLVDLIKLTQNKMKKSKIVQLPEYQKLVNLIIPYSEHIKFTINTVGVDLTSIVISFTHNLYLNGKSGDFIEYRNFKVNSEIDTNELINELKCKPEDRDWSRIKLNNIFNFSDFLFSKNQIPYNYDGKNIEFVSLARIRGKFKLDYMDMDMNGTISKNNSEEFDNVEDGHLKLRTIFDNYAKEYLENIDIIVN